MKVRKDAGQSKLDSKDPNKTTLDKLVDEVKDIHESTYKDVKAYVSTHFSDVHDFESLKSKVTDIIDNVASEADTFLTGLKDKWDTGKGEIEGKVDAFFKEKEVLLDDAKNKGLALADTTADTVVAWIEIARGKLHALHKNVKSKIDSNSTPEKKPTKKTTAKKSTPKKTQTKKTQA